MYIYIIRYMYIFIYMYGAMKDGYGVLTAAWMDTYSPAGLFKFFGFLEAWPCKQIQHHRTLLTSTLLDEYFAWC